MSLLEQLPQASASGHETFTPRYGWVTKGYRCAVADPGAFNAADAIERLGVGKNMVRSIRFWCLAFHVLQYEGDGGRGTSKSKLAPTKLGDSLLKQDGWDPFLEDPASLWLLHWQLFVPPFHAASWSLAFNHNSSTSFDHRQLRSALVTAAQHYPGLGKLSGKSFERDASCLVRMYAPASGRRRSEITCPFTELGLVRGTGADHAYAFSLEPKRALPSMIFLASCFSHAVCTQPTQRSLSLQKIAYDFNSPGVAFKISETEAGRHLERATSQLREVGIDGVYFTEALGNRLLQFDRSPDELYWDTLTCYYNHR